MAPGPRPADAPPRPRWAAPADRLAVALARALGRLLPRPSDEALTALARADRPSPAVWVPTAAELGVVDLLAEGRAALGRGEPAEALHLFGQLLALRGDHAWAWHGRGDALQLLGDPAEARAAYARAAALQPREGLHRLGLANALDALGEAELAASETRAGLALDPRLTWMRPHPDGPAPGRRPR